MSSSRHHRATGGIPSRAKRGIVRYVLIPTLSSWLNDTTFDGGYFMTSRTSASIDPVKLPPHSVLNEETVLGACMVSREAIEEVSTVISARDFFRETNGWIYTAIRDLHEAGEEVTWLAVADSLEHLGRLAAIGGMGKLSQMTQDVLTTVGIGYFARRVAQDAVWRELIYEGTRIVQVAYEGGTEPDERISEASGRIEKLRRKLAVSPFTPLSKLIDPYLDGETDGAERPIVFTGFAPLDSILGGLKRGDLTLIAARPSVGKTALALDIARNAATGQGAHVALFTLEMGGEAITARLLSSLSGVSTTRLHATDLTDNEQRRILLALAELRDAAISVDDSPVLSITDLHQRVQNLSRERPIDLIIVDYLGLVEGTRTGDGRVQEVSQVSRSLKSLARETGCAVLALSQLSRSVEQRKPPIPQLSDLRDSGALEQDADVVVFLYREDYHAKGDAWRAEQTDARALPKGLASLIVAKHRNGPTGTCDLSFREVQASFGELETRRAK